MADIASELKRAQELKNAFQRSGDRAELENSIDAFDRVISSPAFKTLKPGIQAQILDLAAQTLEQKGELTHDPNFFVASVKIYHTAIDMTPIDTDIAPRLRNNCGLALWGLYGIDPSPEILRATIEMWEEAVELSDSPSWLLSQYRFSYQNNLGSALRERFRLHGDRADLDRAIDLISQSIENTPEGSGEAPIHFKNLGYTLSGRAAISGRLEDITKAVASFREWLRTGTAEDQAQAAGSLASMLATQYQSTGDPAILEEAIAILTPLMAGGDPNNLQIAAGALQLRYSLNGQRTDLERSLELAKRAVAETDARDPNMASRLSLLGNCFRFLYQRDGDPQQLTECIRNQRAALDSPSRPPQQEGICANNLAFGLQMQFDRTRDFRILEESIRLRRRAVEAIASPRDRAGALNGLSVVLFRRFEATKNATDLAESIDVNRQALEAPLVLPADRGLTLNNLGTSLKHRYEISSNAQDLEEAIQSWTESLTLVPAHEPSLADIHGNLARGLEARYRLKGNLDDLAGATGHQERAVALSNSGRTDWARHRLNLATMLQRQYADHADPATLERAVALYEESIRSGLDASIEDALMSAMNWANWAFTRKAWQEGVRAFGYVDMAVDRIWKAQIGRAEKSTALFQVQGLGARSAYCHAKAGDLPAAVLALERSRARLLSDALGRDVRTLREFGSIRPEVYRRYESASAELAKLTPDSHSGAARRLAGEIEEVVNLIRETPGYGDFLQPPSLERVQEALAGVERRKLVYLAATENGSLVLIVSQNRIEVLWPELDRTRLIELLTDGGYVAGQLRDARLLPSVLPAVLPEIGRKLIAPLAEFLSAGGTREVVLVADGWLALLPLHAAPYPAPAGSASLIERFAVSYSPNALSLRAAMQRLSEMKGDHSSSEAAGGLLVGVANPLPNPQPLPASALELRWIAPLFKEARRQEFFGRAAARDAVGLAIPNATYLHLSCHGYFNPAHVMESYLALAGEDRLSLSDLMQAQFRPERARLAVLSACQTAIADFGLPDEFIGFPAALAEAGVPAVVGTLWPVDDLSTALLMRRFYELHLVGDSDLGLPPQSPADALRFAQTWLRHASNADCKRLFDAEAEAGQGDTSEAVMSGLVRFGFAPPGERPFEDQPFYWAGFVLVGV